MSHPLRFDTIGEPVTLRQMNEVADLSSFGCQALKRNDDVCGRPSSQWRSGIGTRCRRHWDTHVCAVHP